MTSFTEHMLPAIVQEIGRAMDCLRRSHIPAEQLPIEFELGKFFDAVWIWASESGVALPSTSDFQKDFKDFKAS